MSQFHVLTLLTRLAQRRPCELWKLDRALAGSRLENFALVAMDVAVTVTPGRMAPVRSVILPIKADVLPDCANSDEAQKIKIVTRIKRE